MEEGTARDMVVSSRVQVRDKGMEGPAAMELRLMDSNSNSNSSTALAPPLVKPGVISLTPVLVSVLVQQQPCLKSRQRKKRWTSTGRTM
jgi:hypothetical protein